MRSPRQVLEDNLLKIDVNIANHDSKMIEAMTNSIEEFAVLFLRFAYSNHTYLREDVNAVTHDNANEILSHYKEKAT